MCGLVICFCKKKFFFEDVASTCAQKRRIFKGIRESNCRSNNHNLDHIIYVHTYNNIIITGFCYARHVRPYQGFFVVSRGKCSSKKYARTDEIVILLH